MKGKGYPGWPVWPALVLILTGCGGRAPRAFEAQTAPPGVEPAAAVAPLRIQPVGRTDSVATDADDPAIWVNPDDPIKSLILGTDKGEGPSGALYVFDLTGATRQAIPLNHPNNVDVEYGLSVGAGSSDIAVVTERGAKRLRVFSIDRATGTLSDISGATGVFDGETGGRSEPMGVAVYKRPADGTMFAVVSRKAGPDGAYLWQYRLEAGPDGRVNAVKVREFGGVSENGEIEAVAVDDVLGFVYAADEEYGIRKHHADPDHPDAARELAVFGREGFKGDREGVGIYAGPDGTGYVACADQIDGESIFYLYPRDPGGGERPVRAWRGGADDTDGIEVTSAALSSRFPKGLLVAMNSRDRNFLLYSWEDAMIPGTRPVK